MPSAEIYILGQKYTIKGDSPEAHIEELAALIEARVAEVSRKNPNITPMKALVLTAFNMADELHNLKKDQEHFTRGIEEKTRILTSLFE